MKFLTQIPIVDVAKNIGATIIGDETLMATGLNEIHKVGVGDITFVDVKKYFEKSLNSAASIIILNEAVECPAGKALLLHPNPFQAYNQLALQHRPLMPQRSAVSETAIIDPTAIIEANVVIGHHVQIGARAHIMANTTLGEYTIVGDDVTIQPNCVIGSDAFYYKKENNEYQKWRSIGRVVLENNVEIGAGCTINKGVSGDTIIGEGTKMDCQVHIGHGVVVGKRCLFAAQVGIGGKTIVGDDVVLYGQVGVGQRITIGDGATVLGKTGVTKNIAGHETYFGYPVAKARDAYKELASLRRLPDLIKKFL
jgi:UDP-3-O-[3-hydroxymyristoyl] glucosamine N-acyltransferase